MSDEEIRSARYPDSPDGSNRDRWILERLERNDWLVAPLCPECHRGPNGFHGLGGERPFRARYKLGEVELMALTLEELDKVRCAGG